MNDDDCAPPSHRGALPEGAAEVSIGGATLAMRAFGGSFFNEHGHVHFTEPANSPFGPVSVMLRITSTDGAPLPSEVRAESVWVALERCIWTSLVDEQKRAGDTLEVITREPGPLWDPRSELAVVVALRDAVGRVAYLRDEHVRIDIVW